MNILSAPNGFLWTIISMCAPLQPCSSPRAGGQDVVPMISIS